MINWLSKIFDKPECKDFPNTVYKNCEKFQIDLTEKEKELIASFDCKKYTKDVEPSAYYDEDFVHYMVLESKCVIYRTEIDGYLKWHIANELLA